MFHAEIYCYSTNRIIAGNYHWPFGWVVNASGGEVAGSQFKASGPQNLFRFEAKLEFKKFTWKSLNQENTTTNMKNTTTTNRKISC